MAKITIAPSLIKQIEKLLSDTRRVWSGQFEVPIENVADLQKNLESPLFKRPITINIVEIVTYQTRGSGPRHVAVGQISYGPVKGANKNDMDRFLATFNARVTASFGSKLAEPQ
jgi:hypothetical protein